MFAFDGTEAQAEFVALDGAGRRDLGMPRVDGFGLIDRLRHHVDPRVREVPAAALTAYARSEDRMKALRAGFQIHLAKPIDPAELVTTIAALAKRVVVKNPDSSPESTLT